MGKYKGLQDDVYSIFAGSAWKAEDIKTYPANSIAVNPGSEFIRVSIIPSGDGVNLKSISGVLIVDIFTSAGNGPTRASLIADKLDLYLVGTSHNTVDSAVTQLFNSALDYVGLDEDDKALYKSVYSIPFNYNGV